MQENVRTSGEGASAVTPFRAPATSRPRVSSIAPSAPRVAAQAQQPIEIVRTVLDAGVDQQSSPVGGWSKRAFDVCASASALILLAPLLAAIAIAVRIDSPGHAIFRQERGGLGGRTFRIWKFRTMSVTENRGVVQARNHDARITRLGSFLRRSSWDELPQLINVLMGDMSIIGPRPHALEHDILFHKVDPTYAQRFSARPGVTGLAQVNGCRGPTETDEKIKARTRYDVEYVCNWSWGREFEIIAATVALLFWKKDPGAL
jgi:lipopolysaccharide/colanic/teichoic acid biosynthesis glycosyltransferase